MNILNTLRAKYIAGLQNKNTRYWFILLTILYLFSPIDFIPDLIPGLGLADDLVLLCVFCSEMYRIYNNKSKTEGKVVDVEFTQKS